MEKVQHAKYKKAAAGGTRTSLGRKFHVLLCNSLSSVFQIFSFRFFQTFGILQFLLRSADQLIVLNEDGLLVQIICHCLGTADDLRISIILLEAVIANLSYFLPGCGAFARISSAFALISSGVRIASIPSI